MNSIAAAIEVRRVWGMAQTASTNAVSELIQFLQPGKSEPDDPPAGTKGSRLFFVADVESPSKAKKAEVSDLARRPIASKQCQVLASLPAPRLAVCSQ
jgi:hypothetical protein